MKRLLAALLFIFTGLMSVPVAAGYEQLFKQVKAASWAIYVRSSGGMNAICSAEAYKSTATRTYLVSAGHCFLGSDLARTDFLVTQDHRNFVKANQLRSGLVPRPNTSGVSGDLNDYKGEDWSIVEAQIGHMPVMPLGNSDKLDIGQDLVIVGVPFGVDFLATQGIVGSMDLSLSQLVWNHYYGANIFSAPGNSGSGVISVKQKAIVGILNAGPGGGSSMMIFMPINKLPKDFDVPVKATK
ncbi:MAG: trypsin-like peptidase domain-containing protein [Gammaproteobacteria bacterium]